MTSLARSHRSGPRRGPVRLPIGLFLFAALAVVALPLVSVSAGSPPATHLKAKLAVAEFPGTFATYNSPELWAGGAPADTCFVCNSVTSDGVGTAATSVDPNNDINPANGDFTTTNPLFSVPAVGQDLSFDLTYSSRQAQYQLANNQTYSGAFGWGWSSNLGMSESHYLGSVSFTEAYGAQVLFLPISGHDSCPAGDYQDFQKYTLAGSYQAYCAPQRTDAQAELLNNGDYIFADQGRKDDYIFDGVTGGLIYEGDNNLPWDEAFNHNESPGSGNCPSSGVAYCISDTDPGGRSVTLGGAYGQITKAIDPADQVYTLSYNSSQLTSVTQPNGSYNRNLWMHHLIGGATYLPL